MFLRLLIISLFYRDYIYWSMNNCKLHVQFKFFFSFELSLINLFASVELSLGMNNDPNTSPYLDHSILYYVIVTMLVVFLIKIF